MTSLQGVNTNLGDFGDVFQSPNVYKNQIKGAWGADIVLSMKVQKGLRSLRKQFPPPQEPPSMFSTPLSAKHHANKE